MSSISAVNIKVNNLVSPLGISCSMPEFSWQVSGAEQQSAYRITCAARLVGSTPTVGTIYNRSVTIMKLRVWHIGCAPAFQAG